MIQPYSFIKNDGPDELLFGYTCVKRYHTSPVQDAAIGNYSLVKLYHLTT